MSARRLALPDRYDLARSLGPLALGRDPTTRITAGQVWWATRTPDGPATLHLSRDGATLTATSHGPGADWMLDRADAVAGLRDDLTDFTDLATRHPLVARLAREYSGLRLTATGRVLHHLVPTILSQKVTGVEAKRAYGRLVRHFAEPAPGPADLMPPDLLLPPEPATLAATPYWVLHPFGVEQRRADTIRRAAGHATALEAAPDTTAVTRRLTSIAGIGPWSAAEVVRATHADADAVSVGDYHIPHMVTYALTGRVRGDDATMLELLEPFKGHRGRVCRLFELAGLHAPRFGPRMPIRSFARY
jgi:3-methyladenine DNA glycosylase/8-oxoguanine DNA glycosylase